MALHFTIWDKLSIMFTGKTPKGLFIGLLVSFIFFIMMIRVTDFESLYFDLKETKQTLGYIDHVVETDYSSFNQRPIMKYFFNFQMGDEIIQGYSFSSRVFSKEGDQVAIEYVADNPEKSRIARTKNRQFGFIPFSISVLVLIVVVIFSLQSFKKGIGLINLLHNRVADVGQYIQKTETMETINESKIYTIEYQYKALEDSYMTYVDTKHPEAFHDEEPLFYSKSHPNQSVLFRDLPQKILRKLNIDS